MSSVAGRLTLFALVLAGLFAAGTAAGQLIDPDAPGGEADAHGETGEAKGHGEAAEHGAAGGHGGEAAADPVRGLAVAEHGLRLVVDEPRRRRGTREPLRFRIVNNSRRAVRDFDVEHTKRMHVIVVRRDMQGFQHVHPTMAADGTWAVPLRLDQAGSYRVFADFSHDGEATTLAGDLRVDGRAMLRALPAAEPTATSHDGYEAHLDDVPAQPGKEADLHFTITEDGQPVEIERYLGAGGHLVALREGDLAFLHVHPTESHVDEHGSSIGFAATFPTAGRYRLFLQFKVDGRVQTVAFTQEVR